MYPPSGCGSRMRGILAIIVVSQCFRSIWLTLIAVQPAGGLKGGMGGGKVYALVGKGFFFRDEEAVDGPLLQGSGHEILVRSQFPRFPQEGYQRIDVGNQVRYQRLA